MAGLAAAGLLAAGCSTAGHPSALGESASRLSSGPSPHIRQYLPHTTPATALTPGSRPPGPSPAPAAGSTGAATEPAAAGPAACPASSLRVTVGPPDGAAGSIYYPLDFTNVSPATCTLYGYPGVSFAASAGGAAVGRPAVRNPAFPAALLTLTSGATAHASVQVQVAQSYPASLCKPVTAHWLRVYPPASYVPVYVGFTAVTCTGHIPSGSTLGIYVVRPGVTGP
jgi:hypothetical protein